MDDYWQELCQYEEKRALYEEQAWEIQRRCEEYQKDERWKEMHCRLCPSCKRPIQRLQGCEQMTCGADGQGGNTQHGCGHRFVWNKAPKYVASKDLCLSPVV